MAKRDRHVGLCSHRLKREPDEKVFAKAWQETNRLGNTLARLLNPEESAYPPEPSDRDCAVAATVIQWLGSPVGSQWLTETLRKTRRP